MIRWIWIIVSVGLREAWRRSLSELATTGAAHGRVPMGQQ